MSEFMQFVHALFDFLPKIATVLIAPIGLYVVYQIDQWTKQSAAAALALKASQDAAALQATKDAATAVAVGSLAAVAAANLAAKDAPPDDPLRAVAVAAADFHAEASRRLAEINAKAAGPAGGAG